MRKRGKETDKEKDREIFLLYNNMITGGHASLHALERENKTGARKRKRESKKERERDR